MQKLTTYKKGFTLLLAIVTTAMLLIVSFVVVNVALKQVVLSSAGRESQFAFYAADAGTECAVYWDLYNSTSSPFSTSTPGTITCGGNTITTGSQTTPTYPVQSLIGGGGSLNPTSVFTLNFTKGCAIVRVTKAANGVTTIDSRGYNTCNTSAPKRYERGVTLAFDNGNYLATYPTPYPTPVSSVAVNQSLSSVATGGSQTVSWSNLSAVSPNPLASNWVGLYNTQGNATAYLSGIYLGSCTSTSGAVPADSGSCSFVIPSNAPAGTAYYFQIFDKLPTGSNGAAALAASNNFTVSAGTNLAYGGTPVTVPGQVELENFDTGGEGTSYHDTTAGNTGGAYRSTDVDLTASGDTNGGYLVGWTVGGEWLNYTVNVAASGTYAMNVRVASSGAGGTFHVEMDGTNISGSMSVPDTGGWTTWQTLTKAVTLTAGQHTMKLVMDSNGTAGGTANFNFISFSSLAYGGTPASIPGKIEAENYDLGGEGVGYHDDDTVNSGNGYRTDGVDTWTPNDTDNSTVVGWTHAGEWLKYQVNVAAAGTYTLNARVSASGSGGVFHVEMDGTNISGPITVPDTTSWATYTTVSKTVSLTAGQHTMKIVMDTVGVNGGVANFNWIQFANAYSKVSTITINHTKVTATVTNFPVLVTGTFASLKTAANGGSVQNANGYDIVFASDSACSSLMSWETEKYVASTGEVEYWVKVPTVSGSTDTVFYICYGNSAITSDQSNKTAVWDANYKGVWHLAASGSTFSGTDSTSNGRNVTLNNSPTLTTGIIDGAGNFDQTTNQSTSITSTWYTVFPVTISGWFNTSDTSVKWHTIFQHNTAGSNDGYRVSFYGNTFDFTLGGVLDYQFSNITFSPNTWYYFTVTVTGNGGTATGYILGGGTANKIQSVTIGTPLGSPNAISFPPSGSQFSGKLDEIRLSNIVRSPSWIQTEFDNMNSPSTFYSISPAL